MLGGADLEYEGSWFAASLTDCGQKSAKIRFEQNDDIAELPAAEGSTLAPEKEAAFAQLAQLDEALAMLQTLSSAQQQQEQAQAQAQEQAERQEPVQQHEPPPEGDGALTSLGRTWPRTPWSCCGATRATSRRSR